MGQLQVGGKASLGHYSPLGQGQGHLPLEGPFSFKSIYILKKKNKCRRKARFALSPSQSHCLLLERSGCLILVTSCASSTAAPFQGQVGL